jgi:LacI family transcriptional regulator
VATLAAGEAAATAISAANDLVAIGAMNQLLRTGVGVPHDMAVVGYDDMPLASSEGLSLTTIRQPVKRLAEQSVESLLKRIRSPDDPVIRSLVSPSLVVRRSTVPTALVPA